MPVAERSDPGRTPITVLDALRSPRIRQLSVAEVMAETIRRISNEDSVSSLFIE